MTEIEKRAPDAWSGGAVERRRGRRFPLRLSCRLSLVSMEEVEFAGTVINISRSGILMGLDSTEASGVLRPDVAVRVTVDLPKHPLFSPRFLECTARVVRIVVVKTQTQVAVEIGQIRVTDQDAKWTSMGDWVNAPLGGFLQ